MANKCPRCEGKLKPGEEIKMCSKCGKEYHKWCFETMSKCSVCGELTPFGLRIEERKKNIETNTTNASPQSTTEGAQNQNSHANVSTGVYYVQDNTNNKLNNEETGMFINVSGKIKGLAKAITVIGIISGIIVSIAAMFAYGDHMILASVAMGVGVAFSAWITSLLLYAFGELVANSKESKELQQQILDELRSKDQNKEQ